MTVPTDLERARELYAARAWARAYEAFASVDAVAPLGADDRELYAWAASLSGRDEEGQRELARLYEACLANADRPRAALAAFWIGFRKAALGETATAGGWLSRAQRLVDQTGAECAAAGYLHVAEVRPRLAAGDVEGALRAAVRAAEVGERCRNADLVTFARNMQGRIHLARGELEAAFPLLDDAMLTASSGELSPTITGLVYCLAISACNGIYAIDRSREWTQKLARWCEGQPELVPFSSVCLVHRAEVLRLGGDWSEALDEARRARDTPAVRFDPGVEGLALYEQAEIHRLRGESALAEQAYEEASRHGREPQPGLALLRLAQGKPDVALGALRRLAGVTSEPLARSRFLPALIESALAAGDLEGARAAALDLEQIAERYKTDVLGALAAQSRGAIHLAERNTEAAFASLRSAFAAWQKVDAPYEAARVRAALARACLLAGDRDGALLEQKAARAVFERLRAAPDVAAVDALTEGDAPPDHPLTARELEVLRLVATGKTNKAIAKALFLSEKTVDRHVSNIFAKLDVPSRAAATAYAYARRLV